MNLAKINALAKFFLNFVAYLLNESLKNNRLVKRD